MSLKWRCSECKAIAEKPHKKGGSRLCNLQDFSDQANSRSFQSLLTGLLTFPITFQAEYDTEHLPSATVSGCSQGFLVRLAKSLLAALGSPVSFILRPSIWLSIILAIGIAPGSQ